MSDVEILEDVTAKGLQDKITRLRAGTSHWKPLAGGFAVTYNTGLKETRYTIVMVKL